MTRDPSNPAPDDPGPPSDRAPFTLGRRRVRPGTVAHFELPVAQVVSGAWLSLPVTVIHGALEGPAMWLSAAIHGDELNGIPIIHGVLRQLQPESLRGTVLAVPTVNVFGLIERSRYLPDRRDLNRSFPGSKRGSLAAQLAHLFMQEVVERCSFGIDLHTGSGGRTNLPQIRCNLDHPLTRRLAEEFAAPLTLHADLRDGSLRAAATELGIDVLLYEAGEALRFDEHAIDVGTHGILRVMKSQGMIDVETGPDPSPTVFSRHSAWLRAPRSGFCQMKVPLGARVDAGDPVAVLFDSGGREIRWMMAREAGVLISCLRTALVHRGDAVAHVARLSES